jgi:ABC-type branched-subunit amino acid transport system substrate-binding protein
MPRTIKSKFARLVLLASLLVLSACASRPPRVYRIALAAPFEGRQRGLGYDAFPAFRLALRDHIAANPAARVQIDFVAYDDGADAIKARHVAEHIAADPDVLAVIGHLTLTTTLSALGGYTSNGIPLLVTGIPADALPEHALLFRLAPTAAALTRGFEAPPPQTLPAAQAALSRFVDLSLGPQPGRGAVAAYDATALLLAAIDADIASNGAPTRAGVAQALRTLRYPGLRGEIAFDSANRWADAPVYP